MSAASEPLKNPRAEKFAQARAKGESLLEAAKSAGYQPDWGNAHRLTRNDMVNDRVSYLQGLVAAKSVVTAETLILEAEEIRALAVKAEQYSAATAALREKGILSGARVERNLVKAVGPSPSDLSDEEIEARLEALQGSVRGEQEALCDRLGISPNEITLADFWALEDDERGIARADQALDVTPEEDEPRGTKHMAPLGARGIRAAGWAPKQHQRTMGEAERLARKPGPKIINAVAVPASGLHGRPSR